jgi:glycosyltransferase involved in cell wall biosynthesis
LSVNSPFLAYGKEAAALYPGSLLNRTAIFWFFRRSLKCADGVLTQTEMMASRVRAQKEAPPRIAVAPKAVESEEVVAPQPLSETTLALLRQGPLHKAFTFLYVATDFPYKNHKLLGAIFQDLAARRIQARVIVTLKADQLTALCGPAAGELIRQGYLAPVGWVAKEHLRALYDACDACLMPSLIESQSSAHLEAMNWGKAQICADLPYARDLCRNAAVYVNPADPSAWAREIEALMPDSARRDQLVAAGHARMKEFPASWVDVAMRVRSFLREVSALNK